MREATADQESETEQAGAKKGQRGCIEQKKTRAPNIVDA
jgi:hypothetical protein